MLGLEKAFMGVNWSDEKPHVLRVDGHKYWKIYGRDDFVRSMKIKLKLRSALDILNLLHQREIKERERERKRKVIYYLFIKFSLFFFFP